MKSLRFYTPLLFLAIGLLLSLAVVPAAYTAVFVVDDDTIPDGDPGSLRHAIERANASPGLDIIKVRSGNYVLTLAAALEITDDLTIKGESADSTIIDGNWNSRVFIISETSEVKIEKMTITRGRAVNTANCDPWPEMRGGGILNCGGHVSIASSIISGNRGQYGGGIFNDGGNVTISQSTFSNKGEYGGGIFNDGGDIIISQSTVSNTGEVGVGIYNYKGTMTVSHCEILNNAGERGGAGIFNVEGNMTLTKSSISGNYSEDGEGGINNWDGTMNITHCEIANNRSGGGYGGIINYGTMNIRHCKITSNVGEGTGGISNSGTMTIRHSTISGNAGEYGGGIENSSVMDISHCAVNGNRSFDDGGGINNYGGGELTIQNSTISQNEAYSEAVGGGISNRGGTVSIQHCEITDNAIQYMGIEGKGGGIYNGYRSTMTVTKSTISGNEAPGYGGGIYNSGDLLLNKTYVRENVAVMGTGGGIYDAGTFTSDKKTVIENNVPDDYVSGPVVD